MSYEKPRLYVIPYGVLASTVKLSSYVCKSADRQLYKCSIGPLKFMPVNICKFCYIHRIWTSCVFASLLEVRTFTICIFAFQYFFIGTHLQEQSWNPIGNNSKKSGYYIQYPDTNITWNDKRKKSDNI